MLIIAVSVFMFLIFPLLTAGIRFNVARIRYAICRDILTASIQSAYLAVSADALSLGQLAIDPKEAASRILSQVRRNQKLAGIEVVLSDFSVEFDTITRSEAVDHWLSQSRPEHMPVIAAKASWRFPDGQVYTVSDRIELILD